MRTLFRVEGQISDTTNEKNNNKVNDTVFIHLLATFILLLMKENLTFSLHQLYVSISR